MFCLLVQRLFRQSAGQLRAVLSISCLGMTICLYPEPVMAVVGEFEQRVFLLQVGATDDDDIYPKVTLSFSPSSGVFSFQKDDQPQEAAYYENYRVQEIISEEDSSDSSDDNRPTLRWTELIGYALTLHQRDADPDEYPPKLFQIQDNDPVFGLLEAPQLLGDLDFYFAHVKQLTGKSKDIKRIFFHSESVKRATTEIEIIIMDDSVHGLVVREETADDTEPEERLLLATLELRSVINEAESEHSRSESEQEPESDPGSDVADFGQKEGSKSEGNPLPSSPPKNWQSAGDSSGEESEPESQRVNPRAKRRRLNSNVVPVGTTIEHNPNIVPGRKSPIQLPGSQQPK